MDIPGTSYIEGDVIPIHPEHHKNYAYMIANAEDLDWSLICPGKLLEGEVRNIKSPYLCCLTEFLPELLARWPPCTDSGSCRSLESTGDHRSRSFHWYIFTRKIRIISNV